jgi:SAM-dependent methyltransferase
VSDHFVVPPSPLTAPAPAPVDATLNAARSLLTPGVGLPETATFRGMRLRLQSALLRVLRPYWWQQRELNSLLIEAVRGVNERRAADADARHADVLRQLEAVQATFQVRVAQVDDRRERFEALSQRVAEIHGLQQSFSLRVGQRLESADKAFDAMASDLSALRAAEQHLHRQVVEVKNRIEATESTGGELVAGLRTLTDSVQGFQERAGEHLAQLTGHLGEVATEARTLGQRLYAAPFMANSQDFQLTEPDGRVVLGYEGQAGDGGRVYRGFEDVFRGDEAFIRDRFRVYVPLLREHGPVIDVGCGRGEMLDLLRAEGVAACGVDSDPAMVARCREQGLDVVEADAIAHLRTVPEGSLGAVFAAQFIEHLPYELLLEFLALACTRLTPGGVLIAETVNPHAIEAFKTFWTDLTHQAPIFPEVALTLCRLHGFAGGRILFPHGRGAFDADRRTCGEYAVVATV